MPQQIAIAIRNNARATIAAISKPKKGRTRRPTSGKLHNHKLKVKAIFSK
jgi:hypothetical protein